MKVKIGDKIFDAEEQPLLIILSEADKNNIARMPSDAFKYACFPDSSDIEEIKKWMNCCEKENSEK